MYQKLGFVDRVDNKPTSYIVDGQAKIIEKDDTGMISRGTSLNADNLNYLEDGIYQNSVKIDELSKDEYATLSVQDYVTSLPNSVDGYLDMELEGNTLVNLLGNQGTSTFRQTGTPQTVRKLINLNLKSNTIYTMILKVTNFSGTSNLKITDYTNLQNIIGLDNNNINANGIYTLKIILSSDIKEIWIYFGNQTNGICDTSEIMLLEGDYTNKLLPQYFEGIKSVDSCVIKSVGKNLFNINKGYRGGGAKVNYIKNNNNIEIESISDGQYKNIHYDMQLKPLTNYVLSCSGVTNGSLEIKDTNNPGKYYGDASVNPLKFTSTESGDMGVYLYIKGSTTGTKSIYSNIQLEEGTTATSYEPYKEDKIDISTQLAGDKSLKRLPNGVADSIDKDGVLTRRIGKVVFEGKDEEGWTLGTSNDSTIYFYSPKLNNRKAGDLNFLFNNFISVPNDVLQNSNTNYECASAHKLSEFYKFAYIRINKSRLATPDLAGFKQWLSENNVTVYYELAEPTEEQLQPLNLQSFNSGTLIIDTPIPLIGEIKYPINLGGAVSSNSNAINNVENRTTKLEEGLLVTTATAINNSEKIKDLSSQGAITKFTLTNVVPTNPNEFSPGEIKLVYK